MGGSSSKDRNARVLILGIEAVGKTQLLHKLQKNNSSPTLTIGFNVGEIVYKNVHLCMWDLTGCYKVRNLWEKYYDNTHAVIYVIDSTDISRFEEEKDVLFEIIQEKRLKDAILLIYINKQDLSVAVKPQEIIDRFKLNEISDRILHIQGSSFTTGEGIYEGIDWLVDQINLKFFK